MLEESASAIPSSIWASLNSWFTPTVLFVLLNLVIGTIAFTSSLAHQKQNHENQQNSQNDPNKPHIAKSPSLLHRLKSINFNTHFRSQEPLNPSTHHIPNPDSDTLFNTDHTHHDNPESTQPQSQSHYFFQDNLQTLPQTQQEETHRAHLDSDEKEPESEYFQPAREEKPEVPIEQSMDSHFSRTKSDTEPASGAIPTKLPARMRKSASLKSPFAHFEEEEIVETRRPETVREKGSAKVTDDSDEEVDAKADDFINRFKEQLKLQRLESIVRYKDMIGRGESK